MKEKEYEKGLKYVPHHKMGFKILDKLQLENLFPHYESLKRRIKLHREKLIEMDGRSGNLDSQYNLMYDNIFSIMGKRGSGKTSAVFTLKCMLQEEGEEHKDIALPIIMPEIIPHGCSMIGWVLSLLEETVNDLEKQAQKKGKGVFTSCMYQPEKSLKREYDEVKELCYSQFYSGDHVESLATSVSNIERKTQNSFDFSRRLSDFWNLLIDTVRMVYGLTEKQEPLIYLFFDDVDLLPERVMDLFFTIIKYLSHPNLIVFVTADEGLIYDVIEYDLNNRLGFYKDLESYGNVRRVTSYYDDEMDQVNAELNRRLMQKMKSAREMPKLYGDKILPPSCRYYLETFDTCEKKALFVERVEQGEADSHKITLKEFMTEKVRDYLLSVGKTEYDNFLLYNGKFICAYLLFFGRTSRQLANECLILEEYICKLKRIHGSYKNAGEEKRELYLNDLFYASYYFICDTLNAYGNLRMSNTEIKEMVKTLLVKQSAEWGIYINYSVLKTWIGARLGPEKDAADELQQVMQECIVLFLLLFFVENILTIEASVKEQLYKRPRKKIHGQGVLVELLDEITTGMNSLVCRNISDTNSFLYFYSKLLENTDILNSFDVMDYYKVRNYFGALDKEADVMDRTLAEYSRENPKWFKTISLLLYFSNNGIYKINRRNLPSAQLYNAIDSYDSFVQLAWEQGREQFIRLLCEGGISGSKVPNEELENSKTMDIATYMSQITLKANLIGYINLTAISNVISSEKEDILYVMCFKIIEKYNEYIHIFGKSTKTLKSFRKKRIPVTEQQNSCELIKENLVTLYNRLDYYRICDEEEFADIFQELPPSLVPQIYMRKDAWGNDVLVISKHKLQEIIRRLLDWLKKKNSGYWQNSGEYPKLASRALERIQKNVEEAILTEADMETALQIVALHNMFYFAEEKFITSLLNIEDSGKEITGQISNIPHKAFYNEMKKYLKKGNKSYLNTILKQYIREGVGRYYDKLMGE